MNQKIINLIKSKKALIGIIGMGYVGLPLAREFLSKGFKVTGFDLDPEKVKKLNKGKSYIKHISSDFIWEYSVKKKTLSATADFSKLKEMDFILICVPTPLDDHFNPDLSYVVKSTESVAEYLKKGQVVILESTTYPGTTEEVMLPILEKTGKKVGKDFYLGYSPEREDPGNPDFRTGTIPKVVSAISKDGKEIVKALYDEIVESVPVSSPKIAEASKILENTFRAINIAMVNELKMVFDRMDIDVWEVINAAKTKPFGFKAFYPGPGLGGHCIPIDPFYLSWKAKEKDIHTHFIELAGEINNSMPYYVADKLLRTLNTKGIPLKNAKILIVGVAYKSDVDDMRESPALKVMEILSKEGCRINYYDPYIPKLPATRKYKFDLRSIDVEKVKENYYDAAMIITDHSDVDYKNIAKKAKVIIDTRNAMKIKGLKKGKVFKA